MARGKGRRVQVSTALLEKEIRRLTMLGQRVQDEANMRWILLAAVMRRSGPVTLAQDEINELRASLTAGKASLRVTPGEAGITLAYEIGTGKTEAEKTLNPVREEHGIEPLESPLEGGEVLVLAEEPRPWWRRVLAWLGLLPLRP